MIAKYKKCKPKVFKRDEMVLVWLGSKGGKGAPKRRFAVIGTFIKKCERAENYRYH